MNVYLVVGVLGVAAVLWGVVTYNRLARFRVRANAAWSDIDVQLKLRWDLIPNLVASVRNYVDHEERVFEDLAAARARSMAAHSPREQAEAEEGLKSPMKSLFAIVERYPQLMADEPFLQLQASLEQIEDAIQRGRRLYNSIVRRYNEAIQVFPRHLIANLFGFHERQFFALARQLERSTPTVRYR